MASGAVVVGPEPAPTQKKLKKLHRRGVKRENVLDVGSLLCVLLGMGACWAYINYRFPGVLPAIIPDGNWSLSERMANGLASQTLKRKRDASTAKRKAARKAERDAERGISEEDLPLWEALQPVELEKRQWRRDTQASQLGRLRRPAAFQGTPADGWGVRKTWTLKYLAAHENLQRVDHVYYQQQGYFLHHDAGAPLVTGSDEGDGPGKRGASLQWEPPFSTLNCSAQCFFSALQSDPKSAPEADGCEQAAGECAPGMPLSLSMEMGPRFGALWEELEATNYRDFGVSDRADPTVNMWIASAGSTTAAHYDSYHNFFVQLHGTKRFFLMPPGAAIALYTYPRLHPSYRQAQVDLTMRSNDPRLTTTYRRMAELVKSSRLGTGAGKLDAMVVDLEPGDVLYVPPYWFHLAMTPPARERSAASLATRSAQEEEAERAARYSIGLNVWSEAEELQHVDALEATALPFEDDWSPLERRTAVATYARIFLDEVLLIRDAGQTLEWMVETRWAPLLHAFVHDERSQAAQLTDSSQPDCAGGSDSEADVCRASTTKPSGGQLQLKDQLAAQLKQRQQMPLEREQEEEAGQPRQQPAEVDFGCSLRELPLDDAGRSHFTARAKEAADALKAAAGYDTAHGARLLAVLAWNQVEQLSMWAMGGDPGTTSTSTDGSIDAFLTSLPRKCRGAN